MINRVLDKLLTSLWDEVRTWANTKEVAVKGNRLIEEETPEDITRHIKDFLVSL